MALTHVLEALSVFAGVEGSFAFKSLKISQSLLHSFAGSSTFGNYLGYFGKLTVNSSVILFIC